MSKTKIEKTLEEWVNCLPSFHPARMEYNDLLAEVKSLRKEDNAWSMANDLIKRLDAEVVRLTTLLQQHQTYTTKQSIKEDK